MNMLGDALRDLLDPRLRGGLGSYAGKRGIINNILSIFRLKHYPEEIGKTGGGDKYDAGA
jgi:hypothetical protein